MNVALVFAGVFVKHVAPLDKYATGAAKEVPENPAIAQATVTTKAWICFVSLIFDLKLFKFAMFI